MPKSSSQISAIHASIEKSPVLTIYGYFWIFKRLNIVLPSFFFVCSFLPRIVEQGFYTEQDAATAIRQILEAVAVRRKVVVVVVVVVLYLFKLANQQTPSDSIVYFKTTFRNVNKKKSRKWIVES